MNSHTVRCVALFGASARTGVDFVRLAQDEGLRVNALLRPHSHLPGGLEQSIALRRGSILNPENVSATLEGCDAVCCLFGPRSPFSEIFCAEATRLILEGMRAEGVRRIVCLTGAMVGDYPQNRSLFFQRMARLYRRQSPGTARDREEQERLIKDSGLDWTLVKPPRLVDGSSQGAFRAGEALRLGLLSHVSRTDVAGFLLRELGGPGHIGKTLFIAG